ncbi:MAG: SPFH domain-containing protein [Clostridia bacterium]|nr:SPFH domain-containing protein [Clostridia bacterium]
MGLIKAGIGALGGTLADQWKEFFYCDALPNDVLMRKGQKRTSGRSSNTKGEDNIISNGSGIAVADGQCMIIVEQGKIVEVCAEPGEFTYNSSTEPSIFAGSLGQSIIDTFKTIGKRFTYGGDTGKDQRVYYFNTKEILGNKFGTKTPIMFEVASKALSFSKTVGIRCNGIYSYVISNPLIFYTNVCANVEDEYRRDQIDETLKTEFVSALQPAFGALAELELRPAQIPGKVNELRKVMNDALKLEWEESRGITVGKIALNPISLADEDMKAIKEMEDALLMGSNAYMMAGRMTNASADAMTAAANNSAGAMTGFMGLGMASGAMGGGFNAAQNFYNMGQQQQAQQQQQSVINPAVQKAMEDSKNAMGWKCACGATATGKFCPECGAKKPEPKTEGGWKCACGAENQGKFCANCGGKKPEPVAAEGWTCACGAVNKGKFCPECGGQKPAGVPQYKCDKCGWQPADPTKAPRFCPECGDPFDNGDIV